MLTKEPLERKHPARIRPDRRIQSERNCPTDDLRRGQATLGKWVCWMAELSHGGYGADESPQNHEAHGGEISSKVKHRARLQLCFRQGRGEPAGQTGDQSTTLPQRCEHQRRREHHLEPLGLATGSFSRSIPTVTLVQLSWYLSTTSSGQIGESWPDR